MGQTAEAKSAMQQVMPDENWAQESQRKIPLLAETDLVVVGGSYRAVACAAAAAKAFRNPCFFRRINPFSRFGFRFKIGIQIVAQGLAIR